jgi:AI-2 transport protein TqsA
MELSARISPVFSAFLGAANVGFLLVLIKWGAPVLTPVLVAGFLAALAAPTYFWMQKKGLSSTWSLVILIIIIAVAILLLAGLLWVGANSLLVGVSAYTTQLTEYEDQVVEALYRAGITEDASGSAGSGQTATKLLITILGAVASFAGDLIFGLILVAFLLIDFKRLINLATSTLEDRPFFGKLPEIAKSAGTYFGVRTRLNLVTGVGVGILLWLLGIDYAFLWGAMAFALSYIPYIGLFTAMVPPTILALAEFGPGMAIVVAVGAVAINLLIENIVEPRLTSRTMKLSPVVVLVGFFFWGWMLGATGAMLSMPIMVAIMLVTAADDRTAWLSEIIGTEESE